MGGFDKGYRFWGLLAGNEFSSACVCVWGSLVSQALPTFGWTCFAQVWAFIPWRSVRAAIRKNIRGKDLSYCHWWPEKQKWPSADSGLRG